MLNRAKLDTGNIEINRLSLNMQAVQRDSPAPLQKLRIVLGRSITGNHVDLAGADDRFVYKIDVFQQLHIDGGDFSGVMATQNMIHLIQRGQIIASCVITIADSESFVRVHVEKGEFGVRKLVRAGNRRQQQPAPEHKQPCNRRFQERSASPRPRIRRLQRTAPEECTLQSVRTTIQLVSKATGSVNSFLQEPIKMFFLHQARQERPT
jgi:hypothetical protein